MGKAVKKEQVVEKKLFQNEFDSNDLNHLENFAKSLKSGVWSEEILNKYDVDCSSFWHCSLKLLSHNNCEIVDLYIKYIKKSN